jgi:SanA protein
MSIIWIFIKRMLWIIVKSLLFCLLIVIASQIIVLSASWKRMYSDVEKIPHKKVGLLLGTSPKGRTGRPNQFFNRRIDAAVDLYSAGKIDRIIISGANRSEWYNEPEAMRKELIKRGVPDSILTLDGKGFHTIDSIVRAKKVFGVNSLIIISQRFHNERALFMAKYNGIDAIAYNAANTSSRKWKLIMMCRECGSRVKAVYEMIRYIFK